jgi:hypothetical protein
MDPIEKTVTFDEIGVDAFRRGSGRALQLTQGLGGQHTPGFIQLDIDQARALRETLNEFIGD